MSQQAALFLVRDPDPGTPDPSQIIRVFETLGAPRARRVTVYSGLSDWHATDDDYHIVTKAQDISPSEYARFGQDFPDALIDAEIHADTIITAMEDFLRTAPARLAKWQPQYVRLLLG